jgi:hydroxyacylglutathione hydrolase
VVIKLIVKKYPVGLIQANCYVIFDEKSKVGLIIDPGAEEERIYSECTKNNLVIRYIILTHGHGDHIGAVHSLKSMLGAKVLFNQKDDYLIHGETQKMTPYFKNIKAFEADVYIKNGDKLSFEGTEINIIDTPGHTPGGICILVDNILFTGDTLFQGSVGRSDFEYGSHETLIKSIQEKLLILDPNTIVYPGHGDKTTIGQEKETNPFL